MKGIKINNFFLVCIIKKNKQILFLIPDKMLNNMKYIMYQIYLQTIISLSLMLS